MTAPLWAGTRTIQTGEFKAQAFFGIDVDREPELAPCLRKPLARATAPMNAPSFAFMYRMASFL
jgi:hypothetical protein